MLVRQRRFVADASHELRTPLTSVLVNLELLAESLDGDRARRARSALRSSQRMRRLVADLLLLARTDVGRMGSRTSHARWIRSSSRRPRSWGRSAVEHEISLDVAGRARYRRGLARRTAPPHDQPPGERAAPHPRREPRSACQPATARRGRAGAARRRGRRPGRARAPARRRSSSASSAAPATAAAPSAWASRSSAPWPRPTVARSRSSPPASATALPTARASSFAYRRRRRASNLDNDREHHRPPLEAVVDQLRQIVVQHLLQQVDLVDLLFRRALRASRRRSP